MKPIRLLSLVLLLSLFAAAVAVAAPAKRYDLVYTWETSVQRVLAYQDKLTRTAGLPKSSQVQIVGRGREYGLVYPARTTLAQAKKIAARQNPVLRRAGLKSAQAVAANGYHSLYHIHYGRGTNLQQLARDIFGAPAVRVLTPEWLSGGVEVLGTVVPKTRIFILVLAIVCVVTLAAMMRYTAMGRRTRAVVQHRDLAEASGISSRKTDLTTFFIGSGLAGVAGVALTLIGSTSSNTGTTYLIDAFLVVVIGGLGSIKGTVLAAFALGILNSFIEYSTTASIAKVIIFALIIVVLQIRPQGLFPAQTRSLV